MAVALVSLASACEVPWPAPSPDPATAPGGGRLPVVFLTDGPVAALPAEEEAALQWLRSQAEFAVQTLQVVDLATARLPVPGVLWWHRARAGGLPSASVREEAMASVRDFVRRGGGVFLTLLASPWVVPLGLDSEAPDTVGSRVLAASEPNPVGLQSRWGHPALRRFWGGVYTLTPVADRPYPVAVYSGDRWPRWGRVWAVARRHPEVDPTIKVGIEYPPTPELPNGRLMTLGAYCYFAEADNRNGLHLRLLVADTLRYLGGRAVPAPAGATVPSVGAPTVSAGPAAARGPTAAGTSSPATIEPDAVAPEVAGGDALPLPDVLAATRWWQPEPREGVLWFAQGAGPAVTPATGSAVVDRLSTIGSGLVERRQGPDTGPFTLATPRTLVVGERGGALAEVWAHPVRLARRLRFGIARPGRPVAWLDGATDLVLTARPEGHTLTFSEGDVTVTVRLAGGRRRPALVALLSVSSPTPVEVIAAWEADHGTTWPRNRSLLGPLYVGWDQGAHAAVWRDRFASFTAMAGFGRPPTVRIGGFQPERQVGPDGLLPPATDPAVDEPLPTPGVVVQVPFDPRDEAVLPFVMVGGIDDPSRVREAYSELLADPAGVWLENATYWRDFLADTVDVTTPDRRFDAAFRWAKVGLESLRSTTPGLGTGVAGGYALPSTGPTQPQAVYEGAAATWAAMAAAAIGDDDLAAESLRLLARYRDVDGRIPGTVAPSWNLAYDEADALPLFVIAAERVVRRSGDLELARQLWPAVRAALEFGMAADTDGDGLMEGPQIGRARFDAGLPGSEGSTLYLTSLWGAALLAASRLATTLQDPALATRARELATSVRGTLNAGFWDAAGRYYFQARRLDGSWVTARTVAPAVPLLFGLLDGGNPTPVLEAIASSELSTDWGVRRRAPPALPTTATAATTAATVATSGTVAAAGGGDAAPAGLRDVEAVEPRYTGWAALAEYAQHRPVAAFQHAAANLRLALLEAPGQLGRDYAAETLRRDGAIVHDAAAQALTLLPVLEGLLGLRVDASGPTVEMVPQLPAHWDRVGVAPVAVGGDAFGVTVQRAAETVEFHIERLEGERSVAFRLGARVPADVLVGLDQERSRGVETQGNVEIVSGLHDKVALVTVHPTAPRGVVVFRHGAYPRLAPPVVEPVAGAPSSGLRIVSAVYRADTLSMTVEGLPGRSYALTLASPRRVTGATGVPTLSLSNVNSPRPRLDFTIPGSGDRHYQVVLVITFGR